MGIKKVLDKVAEQFYPPVFRGARNFLGSGLLEWGLLIISIWGCIFISKIFFLLSLFWIENFFFWLIPILIFQFYHWKAYKNKMTLKEYLTLKKEYKIHHIKPLSAFNFNKSGFFQNLKEIKKAWIPENIVLFPITKHREIPKK